MKNQSLEAPTAVRGYKFLMTVGLYCIQCMDKVRPPTSRQSVTARLSLFQLGKMHLRQGYTVGYFVIQMDKGCPPADRQNYTAGFSFFQRDRLHLILGFTVGRCVIQMDKVYPPIGLQNLTAGFYFLVSIGRYFILMGWPLSLSCRDPLRARRQPS